MLVEHKLALFSSVALLLLSVFFSQTIAPSYTEQEKSNKTRSVNNNSATKPTLILTFDDNWTEQIKYVKPTLEKYKLNVTFFMNCNIINKDRAPSL